MNYLGLSNASRLSIGNQRFPKVRKYFVFSKIRRILNTQNLWFCKLCFSHVAKIENFDTAKNLWFFACFIQ